MTSSGSGSGSGTGSGSGSGSGSGTAGGARVHPLAALTWIGFILVLAAGAVFRPDEAAVRAGFQALGPLAPLGYLLAEVVQVVVWPIPGQPFEVAGGWILGLPAGILLGTAGGLAGSVIAFAAGRRYGKAWVEARIGPELRAKFGKRMGGGTAEWVVFWLMLVPAFPRDPLCYLAGLTGLSTTRFALICAIGRPVGLAPWVAAGAGGIELGVRLQIVLALAAGGLWVAYHGVRWVYRRAVPELSSTLTPMSHPGGE